MSTRKSTVAARMIGAVAAIVLSGCASSFSAETITGGFSESEISPGVWSVSYSGNGYTTQETVQTYWLLHAAELTLAQGFDGFAISDSLELSSLGKPGSHDDRPALVSVAATQSTSDAYLMSQKPWIQARIRMVRRPFTAVPGKVFDAVALKATLDPYVTGKKCGGNVCPHVHTYLYKAS